MTTPKIACPYCHHLESKVKNTRPTKHRDGVDRRRECLKCGKRYTTTEQLIGRYSASR